MYMREEIKKAYLCKGWNIEPHLTNDRLFSLVFKNTDKCTLFLCYDCVNNYVKDDKNDRDFLIDTYECCN